MIDDDEFFLHWSTVEIQLQGISNREDSASQDKDWTVTFLSESQLQAAGQLSI